MSRLSTTNPALNIPHRVRVNKAPRARANKAPKAEKKRYLLNFKGFKTCASGTKSG